jgi:hypothetical protein
MTVYYVGASGDNGNAGTSWALRRLTLTSIETLLAAGDTVYVGPGTYREALTPGVSGTAGNIITYIGDYLGTNTDGVGGIVRITGSDNDQTATRANCILNSGGRSYRTFQGFVMDMCTGKMIVSTAVTFDHWVIQQCYLVAGSSNELIFASGATQTNNTIQNCALIGHANATTINLNYSSQINDSANLIKNNLIIGGYNQIVSGKIGGVTVKNNTFMFQVGAGGGCVNSTTALTGGQTITVNNNIFFSCAKALAGQAGNADITENYNTFYLNTTDRANVNTGANSVTYPPNFDARWFFNLVLNGAGPSSPLQVLSPFDLASYSQLVNLAGTSPSTTDMRGTAVQGAQREWGSLEYDSTLKRAGGIHKGRAQLER